MPSGRRLRFGRHAGMGHCVEFFHSIMFPTIFALSVLGASQTNLQAVGGEVSHLGKPMRRISSSKRGSERRGSKPDRSRTPGLNRSS